MSPRTFQELMGNGGMSNNHLRLGLVDHFGETHPGIVIVVIIIVVIIIIIIFATIRNENVVKGFYAKVNVLLGNQP